MTYQNNLIINYPELESDICSKLLVSTILNENNKPILGVDEKSLLCYKFPNYITPLGDKINPDLLLVSSKLGIVLFKMIDDHRRCGDDNYMSDINEAINNIYSMLYSKLFALNELKENINTLKINITPVFFSLQECGKNDYKGIPILDLTNILHFFNAINYNTSEQVISITNSLFDGSLGLYKPKHRKVIESSIEKTKSKCLADIENRITHFDGQQRIAGSVILNGPQRIRGLAGSGKTVILAMKAAQIHLDNPDALVLFTFYTKSLYEQVKYYITKFYRQYSDSDPDWNMIHIRHGRGNQNLPGVYSDLCFRLGIKSYNVMEAKSVLGTNYDLLGGLCKNLYTNNVIQPYYDFVIIDEGQDFSPDFYRLCRRLVKDDKIIWGYDELQNIFDIKVQKLEETFGELNGRKLTFKEESMPSDLILYKCYRNPLKLLYIAVALGLGLYNHRILQMIEEKGYREDLGFEVEDGSFKTGDDMIITRPIRNSPLEKETVLASQELLIVEKFDTLQKEVDFVADSINNDINKQGLFSKDIMVICLDYINFDYYMNGLTSSLKKYGIDSFALTENPPLSYDFKKDNCVTITSVQRAKGNEAGSVYIIGVDAVLKGNESDNIGNRNKLFTAITRSNARVVMTGFGDAMDKLISEIDKILSDFPKYRFKMPNISDLKSFQRDIAQEQLKINSSKKKIDEVINDIGIENFNDLLKQLNEGK